VRMNRRMMAVRTTATTEIGSWPPPMRWWLQT
jgi:hypothetical protein